MKYKQTGGTRRTKRAAKLKAKGMKLMEKSMGYGSRDGKPMEGKRGDRVFKRGKKKLRKAREIARKGSLSKINVKDSHDYKMMGGDYMEQPNEIKFGGPHRLKKAGGAKPDFADIDGDGNKTESMSSAAKQKKGKVPGAIKRAAKKSVKSKANLKKGMEMLGEANTKKETRKAARTMKKGVRQKKRAASIKDNYEFRKSEAGKFGTKGPGIGNLEDGGPVDKKFIGGLVGAVRGFRKNKGKGLGARLKGAAAGAAGGSTLGRAVGAVKGFRGAKGQGLKARIKGAASGALRGSGDEIQAGMDKAGAMARRGAGKLRGLARRGRAEMQERLGNAKEKLQGAAQKIGDTVKSAGAVALGGQDEMRRGGRRGRKKKVDKKLFGGNRADRQAARQERREDRQERRAARQDARQEARAQGAGFFGAIGAGMQAGRDMRQQQQQEAMGQQAQPQQPDPMAPPPDPMAPAPAPMMQQDPGMVQGPPPTKTIDGTGDQFSTAGSLQNGGPTKKFFGGKAKERREDRRERRDIRKAQKAEDKAALEGLSGKEKRQARRAMRQERRQENRALRKEQRLERKGLLPEQQSVEDQLGETAPAMTGSMAGGIDLRPNKVGLDTGGGAAQMGGFRDRRRRRKQARTIKRNVKGMMRQAKRTNRKAQR